MHFVVEGYCTRLLVIVCHGVTVAGKWICGSVFCLWSCCLLYIFSGCVFVPEKKVGQVACVTSDRRQWRREPEETAAYWGLAGHNQPEGIYNTDYKKVCGWSPQQWQNNDCPHYCSYLPIANFTTPELGRPTNWCHILLIELVFCTCLSTLTILSSSRLILKARNVHKRILTSDL